MKRYTYRVEIAFEGSAFASFAPVPGKQTVWSTLRAALISVAPGFSRFAAAGRTDRGVSATGQVVSFISRDQVECEDITRAIDEALPEALAALHVQRVSDSFHAQFSASYRRYVYLQPDDGTLDVQRIDRMLCALIGRRCFNAYARETPLGQKTIKTLIDARARRVTHEGQSMIRFDLAGEAFLRRQVRVIVSTALREAASVDDAEALVRLAEGGDRRATALPAAPEHLFLAKVGYEPIRRRHGKV